MIKRVANVLKENCRNSDTVARFGGEEFVLMLPETNEKCALKVADKIRLLVSKLKIEYNNTSLSVTISAGVSERLEGQNTIDEVLKIADEALYSAKKNGRNQAVSAQTCQ